MSGDCPVGIFKVEFGRKGTPLSIYVAEDLLQNLKIEIYRSEIVISGPDTGLSMNSQNIVFVLDVQVDDCPESLQHSLFNYFFYGKQACFLIFGLFQDLV